MVFFFFDILRLIHFEESRIKIFEFYELNFESHKNPDLQYHIFFNILFGR